MAVTSLSIALLLGWASSSASSPAPPSFSQVRSRRSFAYAHGQPVFYGASPGPSVDRPCYSSMSASFVSTLSIFLYAAAISPNTFSLSSLSLQSCSPDFSCFLVWTFFPSKILDNFATLLPKSVSVLGFSTGHLRPSLRAPPHLPTSNPSPSPPCPIPCTFPVTTFSPCLLACLPSMPSALTKTRPLSSSQSQSSWEHRLPRTISAGASQHRRTKYASHASSRASWVFIAQSHKFRVMIPHPVQWSKFCGLDQSQKRPSHSQHLCQASQSALLATSSLKEPREAILVRISVVSLSLTTKRSTAKCPSATSFQETAGVAQAVHVSRSKKQRSFPIASLRRSSPTCACGWLALREPHTLHTENHCSYWNAGTDSHVLAFLGKTLSFSGLSSKHLFLLAERGLRASDER